MKIDGVPDGWEIVRVGCANYMDNYLGPYDNVFIWYNQQPSCIATLVIVRKVERPKQYRPFASAEEFKPHRDRWCRIGDCDSRVQNVTNERVYFRDCKFTWEQAYIEIAFADGTPFGVEVSE